MSLTFENDKVQINQTKYVDNILTDSKVTGFCPTPASNDLFYVDETSSLLDNGNRSTFHSTVAQLLYLSKRTRPDISLAVTFLTSRVMSPTQQDNSKLHRILKYLNASKDIPLILRAGGPMILETHIDASYGTHSDLKGHSGAVTRVGNSTVSSRSIKQKLNTKSSCESELVATSDCISDVLDVKHFLEELGFHVKTPILLQDNKSTIELLVRGRPTSRQTKHIGIRYFFINDLITREQIRIEYCPTEEMLGDLMTKPLQGSQFIYLRNIILGHQQQIEGSVENINYTYGKEQQSTAVVMDVRDLRVPNTTSS